jgi:uncharacterized protein with PIN domain
VVLAFALSLAVAAPLSIFSAFSWALFYRCPQCKQRVKGIKREPLADGTGNSLNYACHNCKILWDVFWQEGVGDADGGG